MASDERAHDRDREETVRAVDVALRRLVPDLVLVNEQVAHELGLPAADLQALHVMSRLGRATTPSELARLTGLPTSNVTRVVDRLEGRGLVRRQPDAGDRRRTLLRVDDAGIARIGAAYHGFAQAQAVVNARFSTDELAVVVRYLRALSGVGRAPPDARPDPGCDPSAERDDPGDRRGSDG